MEQRREDREPDTLILTEHEPVLTLGRTTKPEHWEANQAEFQRQGVQVHHINRGGSVTYHGPGQMIGYPILRLRNYCPGPKLYVHKLEEVLIRTIAEWGLRGCRHERFRGVWVKVENESLEKIASIGVRITRGITMHGFALNVNVDLQPFSLLSPCGIEQCVMTSMERIVHRQVELTHVREQLAGHFAEVFRLEWIERQHPARS